MPGDFLKNEEVGSVSTVAVDTSHLLPVVLLLLRVFWNTYSGQTHTNVAMALLKGNTQFIVFYEVLSRELVLVSLQRSNVSWRYRRLSVPVYWTCRTFHGRTIHGTLGMWRGDSDSDHGKGIIASSQSFPPFSSCCSF